MIRPATPDDARAIGELHVRVWGTHGRAAAAEIESFGDHFRRVYLENPWYDPEVASLVNAERDGRITGMLGVVVRPMLFRRRRVRMAVSSELAVDPAIGSPLAGVQLLQRFLNGPQELSFADAANDRSTELWRRLGGSVAPLHSLSWVRPMRLCTLGLDLLGRRRLLRPAARAAAPVARIVDAATALLLCSPFVPVRECLVETRLTPEIFAQCIAEFAGSALLRPSYDRAGTEWMWERLGLASGSKDLHSAAVVGQDGRTCGVYVYQMRCDAADVLHLSARNGSDSDVVNTLFRHAWELGAHSVTGRVHPQWLGLLSQHRCLLHRSAGTVLIHARNRELRDCFLRGEAWVSALEGERGLAHVA